MKKPQKLGGKEEARNANQKSKLNTFKCNGRR